jgi:hypothetical protein
MKAFIIILVIVVIGYGGVKGMEMFKTRGDFAERVDKQLNFVSETSMDSVKQDLVADAKKLGIDIVPGDIQIAYEDTEQHTVAQNLVGRKISVQFVNKRVTISVNYVQHILGIPFHENVTQSHIRQVEAPRKETSPEMQQLLDATPQ